VAAAQTPSVVVIFFSVHFPYQCPRPSPCSWSLYGYFISHRTPLSLVPNKPAYLRPLCPLIGHHNLHRQGSAVLQSLCTPSRMPVPFYCTSACPGRLALPMQASTWYLSSPRHKKHETRSAISNVRSSQVTSHSCSNNSTPIRSRNLHAPLLCRSVDGNQTWSLPWNVVISNTRARRSGQY